MQQIITRLREKKKDEGFTLIELLVVVVIIGVLVAIAVPVYLNYRQGAADKSAQSDVRGGISAIEQFYTNNSNTYPDKFLSQTSSPVTITSATTTGVTTGLITMSDKTTMTYIPNATTGATTYLLCATNSGGSGKVYLYDSSAGGSVKAVAGLKIASCTTT
jgi:type IV pilus assembly protein PilA